MVRTRASSTRKDDDNAGSVRQHTLDASEDDAGIPQDYSKHTPSDDFDASSTIYSSNGLETDAPVEDSDADPVSLDMEVDVGLDCEEGESEVVARDTDTTGDSEGQEEVATDLIASTPAGGKVNSHMPASHFTMCFSEGCLEEARPGRLQGVLQAQRKSRAAPLKKLSKKKPAVVAADPKPKCGHRRPPKVKEAPQPVTQWSVTAYLEIKQPPQVVQKMQQSIKRLEQWEPLQLGPLTITHEMTWSRLVKHKAKELE
ncbi:hypothetical protein OH76DRAFT_1424144, partial [Lentinus brumalis]